MSATPSAGALRAAEKIARHIEQCDNFGLGWEIAEIAEIIHEETQADAAALVALMGKVADHLDCCPEDSIEEALANEIRDALAKHGKGAESWNP